MRRLVSISAVASLMVAVACGGGGKIYTAAELADLILQQSDAPSGTTFQAEGSGAQSLDEFADDDKEKAKLREFGFTGAHTAAFVTPGLIEAENVGEVPANARFVVGLAVAFRDQANAEKALDYLKGQAFEETVGAKEVSSSGLGSKAFGASFTSLDQSTPLGGYAFGWQRNNVVFTVIVAGLAGSATESETRSLAEKMDGRVTV